MRVNRREFTCALIGIASASAAASNPAGIRERRVYTLASVLPALEILHRNGIWPESVGRAENGTSYLIPFASLEERTKAWDRFNSDEDWRAMRNRGNVTLKEIRIDPAPYPGGKIFEMSL